MLSAAARGEPVEAKPPTVVGFDQGDSRAQLTKTGNPRRQLPGSPARAFSFLGRHRGRHAGLPGGVAPRGLRPLPAPRPAGAGAPGGGGVLRAGRHARQL